MSSSSHVVRVCCGSASIGVKCTLSGLSRSSSKTSNPFCCVCDRKGISQRTLLRTQCRSNQTRPRQTPGGATVAWSTIRIIRSATRGDGTGRTRQPPACGSDRLKIVDGLDQGGKVLWDWEFDRPAERGSQMDDAGALPRLVPTRPCLSKQSDLAIMMMII